MDTISLARINTAHPKEIDNMDDAYEQAVNDTPNNVHPFVDQVFRSFAESDALYRKGRDANGHIINQSEVVTNAPAGFSFHGYGVAIDVHMIRDGKDIWFDSTPAGAAKAAADPDYAKIIKAFEDHSYVWGGNFPGNFRDVPHFERSHGYSVKQLLAKHNAGDFIPGTTFVNL